MSDEKAKKFKWPAWIMLLTGGGLSGGTTSYAIYRSIVDAQSAHGERLASLEKGEEHTIRSLERIERKVDLLILRSDRNRNQPSNQ